MAMGIGGLGLERRHLLLLFVAGIVSRGFVKSLLGPNASLALLLGVALYYLYMKRQSESIYDEIARQQATAAAKLDAIHGLSTDLSPAETLATRQTHFQLNESERMVVTDRMHRYASKMSGSRKDRKKFLASSRVRLSESEAIALAERTATPSAERATNKPKQLKDVEKIVEESINETL